MKRIFTYLFVVLFINNTGGFRYFVVTDYPVVSDIVLEKNKPIRLKQHFSQVELQGLNGTLYSDSFSKLFGVTDLRIVFSEPIIIEPGALCAAPSLKKVDLDITGVQNSLKEVLKNCDNLEQLELQTSHKDLPLLKSDTFPNLSKLKLLRLDRFKIEHLTKKYFKHLKSLTSIKIISCVVEKMDDDIFKPLKHVEEIQIIYSDLPQLPHNLFKATPQLKALVLESDNITDLTWDEFNGLDSLTHLFLSDNRIKSFNAEKIAKYMPKLKELSIEINVPKCSRLEVFVEELRIKYNHTVDISYKYDPGFDDSCEDERSLVDNATSIIT